MMSRRCAMFAGFLALLGQSIAHAEQWAYAMQTGHGNHSIQVDVDSLSQKADYVAARLLYEYYGGAQSLPNSGPNSSARSALVEGAFDCKAKRFQPLTRTEYADAEAKGAVGVQTRTPLAADKWKSASADPETFAIVDWVCDVAAHRLAPGQAGSIP